MATNTARARELSELADSLRRAHYLAQGALYEKLLPEGDFEETLNALKTLTEKVQAALAETQEAQKPINSGLSPDI